jgi:hypothetical protein
MSMDAASLQPVRALGSLEGIYNNVPAPAGGQIRRCFCVWQPNAPRRLSSRKPRECGEEGLGIARNIGWRPQAVE